MEAGQLVSASTIRFLRARNREGCDIYLYPYAGQQNAGYILVDLDAAQPMVLETMRAHGHTPCVVLQTSPGHLQAWVCLRTGPLEPAVATAAGKWLAHAYGGDPASTDWRHLGRLAGFTNQKPQRRTPGGTAPWVKVVHSRAGLARRADGLLRAAAEQTAPRAHGALPGTRSDGTLHGGDAVAIPAEQASQIYQAWVRRWHIARRFPQPDWSIVDLWVARALLAQGAPPARVPRTAKSQWRGSSRPPMGTCDRTFQAPINYYINNGYAGITAIQLADFNGDGKLDVVGEFFYGSGLLCNLKFNSLWLATPQCSTGDPQGPPPPSASLAASNARLEAIDPSTLLTNGLCRRDKRRAGAALPYLFVP